MGVVEDLDEIDRVLAETDKPLGPRISTGGPSSERYQGHDPWWWHLLTNAPPARPPDFHFLGIPVYVDSQVPNPPGIFMATPREVISLDGTRLLRCPDCGQFYPIGAWPFCPHGEVKGPHPIVIRSTEKE